MLRSKNKNITISAFVVLERCTLCLRKGIEGLRVPLARQDAGTRNPSIPFLRHKVCHQPPYHNSHIVRHK